ncbi:MAG TPA: carboxypeptidase regulatory-like domain-containing protein [Bryobacteraceae bacterium]|nr:carboxypeptidase regulatory-like domain-containing protein [Bryobacteraceae bacterium]
MARSLLKIVFLFAAGAYSVLAQTSAGVGAISGVVTDPSGALVQGAGVVIENNSIGVRREVTTTGGGVFNAPALMPHDGYSVTIHAPGFAAFEDRDITVHVGENVSIPAKLAVQTSATTVEVADEAPIVDNIKTDVSQTIDQTQISNNPINGRRVDQFVLLTPGVVPDGTFGDVSFRGVPGGNAFLIDGNDTTDQYYNENAGRTRIATQISQDAVQEFQVLTDSYSAEYGNAMGGVVNTVTRSGTNSYHGSGFWFFRNRTLDARDPFAAVNPPEVRNQFGGDISGPIIKDKVFFFFNTEEQLRTFPLVSSIINPSVISTATGVPTWVGCGAAQYAPHQASATQCAAINQLLPSFFTTLPRTADEQTAFGKIDWHLNDKNTFSFDFNYMHFNSPNGIQTGAVVTSGAAFNSNGNDDVNVRNGRADWVFVPNGSMVNEARFGWFKDRQADSVNNSLIHPNIGTISLSVAGQAIGFANYLPRIDPSENRFEGADNLSYTVGKHSFKFGVDFMSTEDYYNELNTGNGSYSFANANAFALDYGHGGTDYSSYAQTFGNRIIDTTLPTIGVYAQDQYRVRPNLTLYYGIRYEKNWIPQPPGQYVNSTYPQTGRIDQDNLDFAPRVGFAWSLNKDKTVIRSGFGLYYSRYDTALIQTLFSTNNNYTQSITLTPSSPIPGVTYPSFPTVLGSPGSLATSGAGTIEFARPGLRTPYTEQADFGIQQQLTKNTSMTISYMWSRGAEFFSVRDANYPTIPTTTDTYAILNAQGGTQIGAFTTPVYLFTQRLNTAFTHVYEVENGNNNYYSGLSVQVQHRMSHGFQASLAYTWSHDIDTNLGGVSSNEFFSGTSATILNGDYQGIKGTGSLDQRQRLVINWVWSPTLYHGTGEFGKLAANGWQLSTITTIATPLPYTETVTVLSNPTGIANTGYLSGFNGTTTVPWLGIDTGRLPNDTTRVDARLSKVFNFTEHFRTTLLFEVFNLTNTVTYTGVNTTAYDATFTGAAGTGHGTLYPVAGLGIGNASGGFPDGTNARRAQAGLRLDF